MASSWGSSWLSSWGNSWGSVSTTTAHPIRKWIYRPDDEITEPKPSKPRKLKIKPSLRHFKPETIEAKKEQTDVKLEQVIKELEFREFTKGDRIRYQLEAKRKRLLQRQKEYQEALEYYFEMELQRKIREKDIIYVAMILSEL